MAMSTRRFTTAFTFPRHVYSRDARRNALVCSSTCSHVAHAAITHGAVCECTPHTSHHTKSLSPQPFPRRGYHAAFTPSVTARSKKLVSLRRRRSSALRCLLSSAQRASSAARASTISASRRVSSSFSALRSRRRCLAASPAFAACSRRAESAARRAASSASRTAAAASFSPRSLAQASRARSFFCFSSCSGFMISPATRFERCAARLAASSFCCSLAACARCMRCTRCASKSSCVRALPPARELPPPSEERLDTAPSVARRWEAAGDAERELAVRAEGVEERWVAVVFVRCESCDVLIDGTGDAARE
mmetsp:Transcript_38920/g.102573  ORF Transcript_38920/g.102573 Transcript_38920/m.102573 type:complete len:308 (+) Transcript_38920:172-1095(+)